MRPKILVSFAIFAGMGVSLACIGPNPGDNSCASLGGTCLSPASLAGGVCGQSLPYACPTSSDVCCTPVPGATPGPSTTTSTSSTSPTSTATGDGSTGVDSGGAGVDTGSPAVQDSGGGSPADSTIPQPEDSGAGNSPSPDSGAADTAVADANVADTNVADTNVADTHVADTSVADSRVADSSTVEDSSDGAPVCEGYASPNTTAACHACSSSSSTCQPNGCFNGYWCYTSTDTCTSPLLLPCDAGATP